MKAHEEPIVFDCAGSELIGILHIPEAIRSRGLITVVAGGPQYRAGVGRQLIQLARELSAQGIPILRFDQRGLGDSEGHFRGFEDVEDDLRAAILAFREQLPEVSELVLWGGCDAASAIMINAYKYPEVTGILLGNPWVHDETTSDAVTVKHHYAKRILDKDFWLKVLTLQFNPLPALGILVRAVLRRVANSLVSNKKSDMAGDTLNHHFIQRMRMGLMHFHGDLLLLMSGQSMYSKEFDELINRNTSWKQAIRTPRSVTRHEIAEADQTFSSASARAELISTIGQWLTSSKHSYTNDGDH